MGKQKTTVENRSDKGQGHSGQPSRAAQEPGAAEATPISHLSRVGSSSRGSLDAFLPGWQGRGAAGGVLAALGQRWHSTQPGFWDPAPRGERC